ncbi:Swt1 family HEPN domain-containing protein [Portibacter marinus]|uniref:Swt1 family HEPN domain-containing protein n=1 Tax=Portibacter marinus TaxID=2898660 RepID=UPI001F446DCB|nr:Swt1 family HEPN domain-containing protein [Portibacter marinus]
MIITDYENSIRRIIIIALGFEDSVNYKISSARIEKWKEKREIEKKKYKGIMTETRLIYYSDFYDLKTIILKNWEKFKHVLNDKKRFEVFFSEIEKFRNSEAHGRTLTSNQIKLIEGITNDLKNLITLSHNRSKMIEDYFIEIIKVSDNLGNICYGSLNDPIVLRVDDVYEIIVEANDPKDREIEYEIAIFNTNFKITQVQNRFTFKVTNEIVGKKRQLSIRVKTPASEYNNSANMTLSLIVLPALN